MPFTTFDRTRGSRRERIDDDERQAHAGSIVLDPERVRPRYFDGRFLKADDLTRDQRYLLRRQADLGVVAGSGVATGLEVRAVDAHTLEITAGHGVTASGELVLVRGQEASDDDAAEPLRIALSSITTLDALNTELNRTHPRPVRRSLTGVFAVALRPVEFTSRPIARYPTTITGDRGLAEGSIEEATAVSLLPIDVAGADAGAHSQTRAIDSRRARLAARIFGDRDPLRLPVDALPIAVVALTRGVIDWVDMGLLRRQLGDVGAVTLGARADARPFFRQHLEHLRQVVEVRRDMADSPRFLASTHFSLLPPAGQLPPEAISVHTLAQLSGDDRSVLVQSYFPTEIDCELAVIPDDELEATLEDALRLPSIDLTAPSEALDSIRVAILVPVPRGELAFIKQELSSLRTRLAVLTPRRIKRLDPLSALRSMKRYRVDADTTPDTDTTGEALLMGRWLALVESLSTAQRPLWYVRRRTTVMETTVVARERDAGEPEPDDGGEVRPEPRLPWLVERFDLGHKYLDLYDAGIKTEPIDKLLTATVFENPIATSGLFAELVDTLDHERPQSSATRIINKYGDWSQNRRAGEGLNAVLVDAPELEGRKSLEVLAASRRVVELDELLRTRRERDKALPVLVEAVEAARADRIVELVKEMTQ